jgi:hypothetical protein
MPRKVVKATRLSGGQYPFASSVNLTDVLESSELNKVYTNGTLVDEDLLTDEQAGHCVSIREDESENSFGKLVRYLRPGQRHERVRPECLSG